LAYAQDGTDFAVNPRSDARPPDRPKAGAVRHGRDNVLARVENDVILESDLGVDRFRAESINQMRAQRGGEVPPYELEALERQIRESIRDRLKKQVDIKVLYQHAVKNIPADVLPKIKEAIVKEFETKQIPQMIKDTGAGSRLDLEQKLQQGGSSLEMQKRICVESFLAGEWTRQQVKVDEDITRDELLSYYREHTTEFDRAGRARWEQLTVRVPKYRNRHAAKAALAAMGNEVLRGVPLAGVAKARSDGPTASKGGIWPWTDQGSLLSKQLERAIFGLPVGSLSQILEEESEMHVIRVLERQEATRLSFEEAQTQIREKIHKNREKKAKEAFLDRCRKEVHVWTILDDEPPTQRAAGNVLAR
jgi:peptidyl-prolyl cis-trans isomerase C